MNSKQAKTVAPPKLRFKQFGGEWEEKKLGEFLVESRLAGSDGAKARKITVKLWGKGVYEKQDKIKGSENTKYFTRKAGQLIYSKLDFLNGAFGIIPEELDGLESTLDLPCFDFEDGLDPKYLLEYISREEFYSKFEGGALGGRKARRVTPDEFLNTAIPLPPLPEQAHIAAALSSLDAVITAEAAQLDALRQHKQGLMRQLFPAEGERVPRVRFKEFEDSGEWEEKAIKPYLIESNLKVDSNTELPIYSSTREGLRAQKEYFNDRELDNEGSYRIVRDGEIVYRHMSDDTIFRFNRNRLGIDIAVSKEYPVFYTSDMDSDFLIYILNNSPSFAKFAIEQRKGGTRTRLYFKTLQEWKTLLPTLPEQKRIAALLSSLDELVTTQAAKVDALRLFKRGLMQGLFPRAAATEVNE